MPKFFFHLENSASPVRDTEGADLPDLEAAKCHAVSLFGQGLCANPKSFWETDIYQVTVADADGLTLFKMHLMSVMAPAQEPSRSQTAATSA